MAKHLDTGKEGEKIALAFLQSAGLQILETNWRHGRQEVDIIGKDGQVLVFIEVKTRSYNYFGKPEEFVTHKKQNHLSKAAAAYMELTGHEWEIRFDVVSVLVKNEKTWEVNHLKDAFFPGLK